MLCGCACLPSICRCCLIVLLLVKVSIFQPCGTGFRFLGSIIIVLCSYCDICGQLWRVWPNLSHPLHRKPSPHRGYVTYVYRWSMNSWLVSPLGFVHRSWRIAHEVWLMYKRLFWGVFQLLSHFSKNFLIVEFCKEIWYSYPNHCNSIKKLVGTKLGSHNLIERKNSVINQGPPCVTFLWDSTFLNLIV